MQHVCHQACGRFGNADDAILGCMYVIRKSKLQKFPIKTSTVAKHSRLHFKLAAVFISQKVNLGTQSEGK